MNPERAGLVRSTAVEKKRLAVIGSAYFLQAGTGQPTGKIINSTAPWPYKQLANGGLGAIFLRNDVFNEQLLADFQARGEHAQRGIAADRQLVDHTQGRRGARIIQEQRIVITVRRAQ